MQTEVNEIWYPIPSFEGLYEFSNLLRIKSLEQVVTATDGKVYIFKERVMKITKCKGCYAYVTLVKNGKKKVLKVHRLFGIKFIPNPENKEQLNHKNGNKHDYSLDNLEWVTRKQNYTHAVGLGLIKIKWGNSNPIYKQKRTLCDIVPHNAILVLDTQTGIFYNSITEAAIAKDISISYLTKSLYNKIENKTSIIFA